MKPKLLFLFPDGWDRIAFASALGWRDEFDVVCEGFDLFRFPESANILWFDAHRFIERLARKYRRGGIAGVVSTNEQYGALIAAMLARRIGLPGTDPLAIKRAQHKYYAREAMASAIPHATPRYIVFPPSLDPVKAATLPYPLFVKPVKAAYSVLARRVDSLRDLQTHLSFRPWEKHILARLIKPFNDLTHGRDGFEIDAHHLIGEEPLEGVQVNVDGFVHERAVRCLGVVDSVLYPGTTAFQRFEYPSRLPDAAQRALKDVARQAITAIGFDHGVFNVELFYRPRDGDIKVIEINPRLAAQFGDLYEKVDGMNPYRILADLAVGREPRWVCGKGTYGAAASFVLREFNGGVKLSPAPASIRWLRKRYPDAHLQTFIKRGNSRWREMKWLGSYRYATINLGGTDREELFRRYEDICANVLFERAPRTPAWGALATLARPLKILRQIWV
jgi:hypothetical protein